MHVINATELNSFYATVQMLAFNGCTSITQIPVAYASICRLWPYYTTVVLDSALLCIILTGHSILDFIYFIITVQTQNGVAIVVQID